MKFTVAIAALIVISHGAPIENSDERIIPEAAIIAEDKPIPAPEPENVPHIVEQPISNEPIITEPDKIEDHPQNLEPTVEPVEEKIEPQPNAEPETNLPGPNLEGHHVQEHDLNAHPDVPIEPVISQHEPEDVKPQQESSESDEDDDVDFLQALGLFVVSYEMELLDEIDQLENRNSHHEHHHNHYNHDHSHEHDHAHDHDHPHDHNHPHDHHTHQHGAKLPCDC